MSAFHSLVRVHTWALSEKRQKLAQIEALADKLGKDLAQLEAEIDNERHAAGHSLEGTTAFPAFVAAALERRKRLRDLIANLQHATEQARAELNEAYQELKKYELARDNVERKVQHRQDKRERDSADELGIALHRRDRPKPEG